jgi:hypothetical protein
MVNELVRTGDLFHMQPAVPSTPCGRHVFASQEVRDALVGPWADAGKEDRLGRARALLDAFTEELRISVRMPPSTSRKAQLALLQPRHHEVWEFRAREPNPGVRIFGRFTERNHFVALTYGFREEFKEQSDWDRAIENCKHKWGILFPVHPPHKGNDPGDYLTNAFLV